MTFIEMLRDYSEKALAKQLRAEFAQMKVGDEVEFKGQRGKVTWATSGIVDLTFDNMSPIAYEILAQHSLIVAKHYNGTKDVFTLDRKSIILRDLIVLGNANVDNKCCCGGDSIGATRHPKYCPRYSEL